MDRFDLFVESVEWKRLFSFTSHREVANMLSCLPVFQHFCLTGAYLLRHWLVKHWSLKNELLFPYELLPSIILAHYMNKIPLTFMTCEVSHIFRTILQTDFNVFLSLSVQVWYLFLSLASWKRTCSQKVFTPFSLSLESYPPLIAL